MFNFLKKNKKKILVLGLVIIALFGSAFYFWLKKQKPAKPAYLQVYRLVPEKISQSAQIRIYLPPGITKEQAKENIEFYPKIEGEWLGGESKKSVLKFIYLLASLTQTEEEENIIIFKPREKLRLNRYYGVKLTMPDGGIIKSDFLSVEDPKIIAVFPKEGSETPENSEITIVFNRPMVPLTTLGYLEKKDVPVEITPTTEGRFKWITTRNLQFIPKERLKRSSHYEVKIKSGFVSMDGLGVAGRKHSFITRKLRYLNLTKNKVVYDQPISIYFNQPVDLERTKREISLRNETTGKEISFVAEYASEKERRNSIFGESSKFLAEVSKHFKIGRFLNKEEEKGVNKSIIKIYPQKDRFGRERLWDFKNNYSLVVNRAYPLEGDIILDEKRRTSIFVPSIIKEISAESERTRYASPNFFDPEGKIWVSFYEEINLKKSKIKSSKLKEIGYGQKCKEGETFSKDVECEKIPDKKRIYLTFKSGEIGLGERLEINFEKIVNLEGLTVNKEPISRFIVSYPKFEILRTAPSENSSGADLTKFVFCSNSPIAVPAKEDWESHLKSNLDYELKSWGSSWRVNYRSLGELCRVGEFHTTISYGLMPLADYSLEFQLEDVFAQKLGYSLKFTTGKMPSSHLSFYHLQKSYNVTSPQKTKLTFATENMEYVDLEICKLDALNFLYYLEKRPKYYEPPYVVSNCQKIVRDRIELPKRYWIKNYFKVDLKDYFEDPIGHYILTFSHPNYREKWGKKRQIFERSYLTCTNLAVAEKRISPQLTTYGERAPLSPKDLGALKNLYWVTDISTLKPISGAKISLYRKQKGQGFKLVFANSYTTDDQGIAFTDVLYDLKGAIIKNGKDSTVIPSRESRLEWVSSAYLARKIYIYTDKPIYRPSQEVFIKGIYRIGYSGSYEVPKGKINLKIFNSKNDEIFSKDLEINEFGTFNTSLVLEKDAPLGMYRVCAKQFSCSYFDVQEYVPAPFEVNVKTDKEEYISKDTVNLEIEANYYFGVPLESGEVTYTISSQNYYFDRYSDGYFSFGRRWYYWPPHPYGEKFILRGKTSLGSDGKAKISQLFDLEKLFKNKEDRKSKIIVVDITVRNPQGQSVSVQKSFILHSGEFYLGMRADRSFLGKNEKTNLRVKSVDTNGKEIRVKNISLNIFKTDWIYAKRLGPAGTYTYKWEKKREKIKEYHFNTDKNGNYIQPIQISKEGSYELEVSAQDKRGNLIYSIYNIYIYGPAHVSVKPTEDTKLEIEAEKTELSVGEQGKIIIKSPYPKAKAFISIERGKIFDYQIREIDSNLYNFNFKVKEEYTPNVFVSVLLVSSKPEIKFGKVEFKINTERKEVKIDVKSNKKYYLPGEEVSLDIQTKDYQGKPVKTELSVAVADLSVLALKGNPKKNPLIFFYAGFPLTVQTSSNIKNILIEFKTPTKGGGGLAPEALARKKRGVFRETAFWQAVVRTDENGRAQVKFTLPDNLTTWQAETLGITKDTKLGVNYQEFVTRKELMVVPLKPRFVVPGDVFYIGAKIFNQSKRKQKVTVSFDSQTLILKDNKEKKVKLSVGGTKTVYFKVQAPDYIENGEHVFILSAKSKELEDTVQMAIDVTPNNTYEVTATANYTSDLSVKEYVFLPGDVLQNKGDLTIKSSATLAVFLSDSLNYLLKFPYGCAEQIASKLNAVAIVKRGLNLPNIGEKFKLEKIKYQGKEYSIDEVVQIGLSKLYNLQKGDGGFAFWRYGKSSFYATLHVVNTLNNLSRAGYEINQDSLKRAANYLYRKITTDYNLYRNKNNVILTAYTLFRLPNFTRDGTLRQKIIQIANDDLFIKERISNSSLAYLAILLSDGKFDEKLKNRIFDVLENRIDIDARGAFLEPNQNFLWYYFETPIKDTALLLKALSSDKRDIKILDKVVRWLLNSREKDGAWGSTQNTITVIDAFCDFLEWKRETESNFTLDLSINDKTEGSFDFNPDTILDQFRKRIPLKDLKFRQNNIVEFLKTNHNKLPNSFYYDLALKYFLPADRIPPRDEGFSIIREFYNLEDEENKNPLSETKVGEVLRGHIQITVPATRNFVMIEDFIPAGTEIVNTDLSTEQKSLKLQEKELKGREFRPDFKEIHDDRLFLFKERVYPGVYEFDYYIRALIKGKFNLLPAMASEMYFPENFGRTSGAYFEIK